MAPRAYAYIRFSTPEQGRDEAHSLERQLSASEAWAAENGLELDTSYRDLGVSGFTGANRKKGHLGRFLKAVEDGVIPADSFLVLENCDRLSREEPLEAFDIFKRIVSAGVTIVTTDDRQTYNRETLAKNPMQLMFWIMGTIRGNAESQRKSKLLGPKWAKKKRDARETRKAISASCPRWLRKVGDHYEPIEERAAVVKRIFNDLDDGLGVNRVTKRLNDEGVPPMGHGNGWHHSIVLQLVRSGAVIGHYQPMTKVNGKRVPDGDVIPDYYPPVIEPDQFHRVNALLTARRFNAPGRKGVAYSNLFQGIAKCGECGGSLIYNNKGSGKGAVALKCSNAMRGHQCGNKHRYHYKPLEAAILRHVPDFDLTPPRDRKNPAEAELTVCMAEREKLKAKIANLLSLVEEGDGMAIDLYRERKTELTDLEQRIETLSRAVAGSKARKPAEAQKNALQRLTAEMATASPEDLYAVRARIAEAIRAVVDVVICERSALPAWRYAADFEVRPADPGEPAPWVSVMVLGGLRTYGFDGVTFELQGKRDWTGFVEKGVVNPAEFIGGDAYREQHVRRIMATAGRRLPEKLQPAAAEPLYPATIG